MTRSDGTESGWREPTLVISFDFELAWGSFDRRRGRGREQMEMARWTHDHGASELLEQLTRNGLSATWAVVGLVMLDRLPDLSRLAPLTLPDGSNWFSRVPPDATEENAPQWFGASLISRLREATPVQEIGFHGFSHATFTHRRFSRERARQELELCRDLARSLGLVAPPFVYPRNYVAYLDELRAAGFRCYRGPDELPFAARNDKLRRLLSMGSDVLGLRPRMVQPRLEHGLVNVPGSMFLRYLRGWRKHVPDASQRRRLRTGLRELQRGGGVFHVWLHPENLFFGRPRLQNLLFDFFAEAADLAGGGRIRVRTMGDVAREVLARAGEPNELDEGVSRAENAARLAGG